MELIEIPKVNSENFYQLDASQSNLFHTKHFLSDWWQNTLRIFERYNKFYDLQKPKYFALKQFDDVVTIQLGIPTAYTKTKLQIYRPSTGVYTEVGLTYRSTVSLAGDVDSFGSPLRKVQYSFPLSVYVTQEDYYFFVFNYEDEVVTYPSVISEPTWIKAKHDDTVLIQYTNTENDYDVAFQALEPLFSVRISALLKYKGKPVFNRVVFRNQKTDLRQLSFKLVELFELTVGIEEGVNDVYVNKLAYILRCDTIFIDNKQFLLSEGAEFEPTPFGSMYPMSTLKIELEQYINSDSTEVMIGDNYLILAKAGVYPYVITKLRLSSLPIPTMGDDYILGIWLFMQEVLDSTMEDNLIDALNAIALYYGVNEGFMILDGFIVYDRGADSPYISKICTQITDCLQVEVDISTGENDIDIFVQQSIANGEAVLSCWQTPEFTAATNYFYPTYMPYVSGTTFGQTYTIMDNETYRFYIYLNNYQTIFQCSNAFNMIKAIEGTLPRSITSVSFNGGDIPIFEKSWLYKASEFLISLQYLNMGVTTIDADAFSRDGSSTAWNSFVNVNLSLNELNAAAQDNFYINYFNDIASFYLLGSGTLATQTQTPSSAPTSLSLAARTNLISLSYTVLF